MRSCRTVCSLLVALALAGCSGTTTLNDTDGGTNQTGSCLPEDMICVGDPDSAGGMVCLCPGEFVCPAGKCTTPAPVPPGGGDWQCTWSEHSYACTKPGSKDDPPPGSSDWYCNFDEASSSWVCKRSEVPLPPGGGAGWTCEVKVDKDGKISTLDCTPPPGTVPAGGEWSCVTGDDGKKVCTQTPEEGLPSGGSDWKCNLINKDGVMTWVCYGTASEPPGGSGWNCVEVKDELGNKTYKCEKPAEQPPGGGYYVCEKGSEFGGTKCYEVDEPPTPPTKPGDTCAIGEKMWCDGLDYCGWGQVECDPATGTWKTKVINGQKVLDCYELSDGRRPNTVCACYHFFFNAACCERLDCIVPAGSSGQICPKSAGKLCDYCNPQNPECVETGAQCIVTNTHETFCGRLCSPSAPCPADYKCVTVKLKVGTTNQCIPVDQSCYY